MLNIMHNKFKHSSLKIKLVLRFFFFYLQGRKGAWLNFRQSFMQVLCWDSLSPSLVALTFVVSELWVTKKKKKKNILTFCCGVIPSFNLYYPSPYSYWVSQQSHVAWSDREKTVRKGERERPILLLLAERHPTQNKPKYIASRHSGRS